MPPILALDQGTTSSRALVFDEEGRVLALAREELRQIYPRPGWVEHDPLEIWSGQVAAAERALAQAGLAARDVAAVGITNQRETTLVWDRRSGAPLCNAIVWQDRRTADLCDALKAQGLEATFRERTGLLLDPYFSGTKLRWILDHIDGARARAERGELAFGTVDSWLAWNLTGGARHVSDASNASRTLLFDLRALDWSSELCELLRVPQALLPRVCGTSEVVAEVAEPAALRGLPLAALVGDQQAALAGQGCVRPGMAKNTYGTGCFLLMNTGAEPLPSRHGLVTTVALRGGGAVSYALEGSVFVAGAIVQWLRDGLGLVRSAGEVEALARSVEDSGGVVLVPALAGLGAPHWDPRARGTLLGITGGTRAGHVARAALEGIAFQVADLLEAMERDGGRPIAELRVDGGAAANDLLMQFQADLLGIPLARPAVLETTALGAAVLAGAATGAWGPLERLDARLRVERRFEPAMPRELAAELRARWSEALRRARGWA